MDDLPYTTVLPQRLWVRVMLRLMASSTLTLSADTLSIPSFCFFSPSSLHPRSANLATKATTRDLPSRSTWACWWELFWGLSADALGRRLAFNISLLICSVATIISGAMLNWASLGFFISLVGFGGGGNLVMDTTIFLEYLPGNKQWVLTFMAAWWGVSQAIAGFISWGFLGKLADARKERAREWGGTS